MEEYQRTPWRKKEVADRLEGKKSREESNYRPQRDPEAVETCFECQHYMKEGEPSSPCEIVAGIVEADDVCDHFKARTEDSAQPTIEIKVSM